MAAIPQRGRDSQRAKVYALDRELTALINRKIHPDPREFVDLHAARALVEVACRAYGFPRVPRVEMRNGNRGSANPDVIKLPRAYTTLQLVLHEAAHVIAWDYEEQRSTGGHGPTFVRVLLDLYERYLGVPLGEATKRARARKVKIGLRDECPRMLSESDMRQIVALTRAHQEVLAQLDQLRTERLKLEARGAELLRERARIRKPYLPSVL